MKAEKLRETYRAQLRRVHRQIARRPEMRTLSVNYGDLLADAAAGVDRLAQFLGEPFNCLAAVNGVRPELRRQKSTP